MPRSARIMTAAVVLAASLVVPALASAGAPKPGGYYFDRSPSTALSVSKNGKKVTDASVFTKCNEGPPANAFPMRIKNGRFSYSGPAKDTFGVGGDTGTIEIAGRFASRKVAKGTVRYVLGDCDSGVVRFRAVLQKTAGARAAANVALGGTFHEHSFKVLEQHNEGAETVITRSLKVNFHGTFKGKATAVERVTLHPDGTGEVTGRIDFEGCVTHRCGTAEILFEGTLPNPEVANGTFTVVSGTGELAGIRGKGEFFNAPDGTYTGTVRF